MREAACLHQSSRLKRLFRIDLPLVKRGLAICWIIVFIFSMGELGATLLVIPPGAGTLSLKIYTLMHYGAGPLVAALSIILILVSLLFSSILLKTLHQK
jgi:iron(III) transport system permease protein